MSYGRLTDVTSVIGESRALQESHESRVCYGSVTRVMGAMCYRKVTCVMEDLCAL